MKPKLQKSPSAKKILGNVGGRVLEGYIMILYFCMCKRAGQIFNTLRFSGEQLQVFQSRKGGGDLQREVFRISGVLSAWVWIVENDGFVPTM